MSYGRISDTGQESEQIRVGDVVTILFAGKVKVVHVSFAARVDRSWDIYGTANGELIYINSFKDRVLQMKCDRTGIVK